MIDLGQNFIKKKNYYYFSTCKLYYAVCSPTQNISVIYKDLIYCYSVGLFTRLFDGYTVNPKVTCYTS